MIFFELLEKVKKLHLDEIRNEQPDYLECVVPVAVLPELSILLGNYFGPPLKTAGQSANKEHQKITSPYGGIEKNQTLFQTGQNGKSELAMLWPWGGGASVTLKIAQCP